MYKQDGSCQTLARCDGCRSFLQSTRNAVHVFVVMFTTLLMMIYRGDCTKVKIILERKCKYIFWKQICKEIESFLLFTIACTELVFSNYTFSCPVFYALAIQSSRNAIHFSSII